MTSCVSVDYLVIAVEAKDDIITTSSSAASVCVCVLRRATSYQSSDFRQPGNQGVVDLCHSHESVE